MTESEKKTVCSLIEAYEKSEKLFPFHNKLLTYNESYMFIFAEIDLDEYFELLKDLKIQQISKITKSAPRMKNLFLDLYNEDKKLFTDFLILNINKDYLCDDFQIKGKKIEEKIMVIKEDLLGNMENGKYLKFSSSMNEKFDNYIKMFFPYYNNVGVTIRKK